MAWRVATALAAAAAMAGAGENPAHVVQRERDGYGPTAASQTLARLNASAQMQLNAQSVSRIGIMDVAWPSSLQEHETSGRNGILQVSVVVPDKAEIPLRAAYVHVGSRDTRLKLIARKDSLSPEGSPARRVGAFREDSYYLLPIGLAQQRGSLLIDFAAHRTGFQLSSLPLDPPTYRGLPRSMRAPNNQAVRAFLKREFPEAPAMSP